MLCVEDLRWPLAAQEPAVLCRGRGAPWGLAPSTVATVEPVLSLRGLATGLRETCRRAFQASAGS